MHEPTTEGVMEWLGRGSGWRIMLPIVMLGFLVLSGCVTRWSRPGATESEFRRDMYECLREAQMLADRRREPTPPLTGGTVGAAFGAGVAQGASEGLLIQTYREECMRGRGYTPR